MESLGGFRSFPAIEQVAITLILICAALHCIKSEMESLVGFRFHPTIEQIFHLLEKKRLDPHFSHHSIKDIDDICSLEPWDLSRASDMESEEQIWYFFYEPYYKYKESNRTHRRTNAGYWKVTGRGSKIKARNGLTGSKKILTFYRHGPASKKAKTEWVMHEFHVKDNSSYKKEFVLCRIERKSDKKVGVSTIDEGELSQVSVSPTQPLPSDHMISSGNRIEANTLTNLQLLPPNHNLISYPGNHIVQNTVKNQQLLPTHNLISYPGNHIVLNPLSNLQLPPNDNLISCSGNHIDQNTLTTEQTLPNSNLISYPGNHIEQNTLIDQQLLPNHNFFSYPGTHIPQNTLSNLQLLPNQNMISYPGNHIVQKTPSNPQLPPNYEVISYPGNQIEQNTFSSPQLPPDHNLISYPINHLEQNTVTNPQLLLPNNNLISYSGNPIEQNTLSELQLPPYCNSELQLVPNQFLVKNNVAENTLPKGNLLHGEFDAGGGFNGLNNAFSLTPQSTIYPEMELSYSNNSIGNCDLLNSQCASEQVNYQFNWARDFQDENSL